MAEVSILIPTHNRHGYLDRCADWFLSGGYRVVVADSTAAAWTGKARSASGLTYLHRPGGFERYTRKICDALDCVETPYVALCADDDFILHSGLEFAADFLSGHPDYAFCQGVPFYYQTLCGRFVSWPYTPPYDLNSPSWLERVLVGNDTVYYGLHRSQVAREAFAFMAGQPLLQAMPAAGLADFAFTCVAARAGKLMFARVPFGIREYSPQVNCVGSRHALLFDERLAGFYSALLRQLVADAGLSDADLVRLQQRFSADLAGQLQYDQSASRGMRGVFAGLPGALQDWAEYLYRQWTSLRVSRRIGGQVRRRLWADPGYAEVQRRVLDFRGTGMGG